jgi:hypothetical protein
MAGTVQRSKQLDPTNIDAIGGLDRIEKLYGAGQ